MIINHLLIKEWLLRFFFIKFMKTFSMADKREVLLLFCLLFFFSGANAQFELAHYSAKGSSGFGFGGYLDGGVPITNGDIIMIEGNADFFGTGVVFIYPVLAGYRHYLRGKGR
jgi:hypothetical protein